MLDPKIRERWELDAEGVERHLFDILVDIGAPGHPDLQVVGTLDNETEAKGAMKGWKWCREIYSRIWG